MNNPPKSFNLLLTHLDGPRCGLQVEMLGRLRGVWVGWCRRNVRNRKRDREEGSPNTNKMTPTYTHPHAHNENPHIPAWGFGRAPPLGSAPGSPPAPPPAPARCPCVCIMCGIGVLRGTSREQQGRLSCRRSILARCCCCLPPRQVQAVVQVRGPLGQRRLPAQEREEVDGGDAHLLPHRQAGLVISVFWCGVGWLIDSLANYTHTHTSATLFTVRTLA